MNQEIISKKWNNLFDRATQIKIQYIKEQCPICKNKNIRHFLDCTHLEIDLDEINKRIKKEIGNKIKLTFRDHLSLTKA